MTEGDHAVRWPPLVVVVGPTAAGKSELAVRLALQMQGEVVSADSMQVYRHFDIGTGKLPLAERHGVTHHLVDIVEPCERFSAARFVKEADQAIAAVRQTGRLPVVVGGSGLYLRALLRGLFDAPEPDPRIREAHDRIRREQGVEALYARLRDVDPEAAESIDANDFVRISRALEVHQQTGEPVSRLRREHAFSQKRYDALILGLRVEPSALRQAIDTRVDAMVDRGWLEEVRELRRAGHADTHPMGALGYRQLSAHLAGDIDFEQAVTLTKRETWRFSRRQRNWFGHEPAVLWIDDPQLLDGDTVQTMLRDGEVNNANDRCR